MLLLRGVLALRLTALASIILRVVLIVIITTGSGVLLLIKNMIRWSVQANHDDESREAK